MRWLTEVICKNGRANSCRRLSNASSSALISFKRRKRELPAANGDHIESTSDNYRFLEWKSAQFQRDSLRAASSRAASSETATASAEKFDIPGGYKECYGDSVGVPAILRVR